MCVCVCVCVDFFSLKVSFVSLFMAQRFSKSDCFILSRKRSFLLLSRWFVAFLACCFQARLPCLRVVSFFFLPFLGRRFQTTLEFCPCSPVDLRAPLHSSGHYFTFLPERLSFRWPLGTGSRCRKRCQSGGGVGGGQSGW